MGPAHENFLPSKIFEKFVKKISRGADAPTTRCSRRIFRGTMTNVSTFARAEFQARARLRGAQHLAGTQKKFSPKIGCPRIRTRNLSSNVARHSGFSDPLATLDAARRSRAIRLSVREYDSHVECKRRRV